MKSKHYELDSEGRIYAVTINKNELAVQRDIVAKFAVDVGCKMGNLVDAGILGDGAFGKIGMCAKAKMATFTIPVASMPMRAAFIMKDGYMVPDFTSSSNDTMDLKWSPPPTMRLYLMVYCPIGSPLYSETQFLVAVDGNGRFWRLPTSNTYEDCKLCTGSYNSEGATFVDVLSRAWNQFQTSRWQKDLNDRGGTSGMSNSRMMFRYKPLEKDQGFEQVPAPSDWSSYCTKVSNEFITNNIIL